MKDEFLSQVNDYLVQLEFVKNEDSYTKKVYIQPSQQVVINGQVIKSPPIEGELIVNLLGTGLVISEDETQIDFELIEFIIKQNDEIIGEINYSYYYDFEEFVNIFNNFFKQ